MRTNDLFLTAAAASMMMFAACTHDDGTASISEPTPVGNELIISTRHSEMGITRAESNIQSSKFDLNAEIDVFLKDASGVTDSTLYAPNPKLYKVIDTNGTIKTYSAGDTENRLFWPKLMHELYIFGVYPVGSVANSKLTSVGGGTYNPFDHTLKYDFIVQEDQTSEANYKASDLMTGLPSGYSVHATSYTAPFKLTQHENPGIVPLLFTHRLTKVVVNITKTTGTEDTDIKIDDDIIYTGENDKKYARVVLVNTKRKTWFRLYNNNNTPDNTTDDSYDEVMTDRILTAAPDSVIVGQGQTTIASNANSLTLSAIVPPQTITGGYPFIKVFLIDNSSGSEKVTNTFIYKIPEGGLTLQASRVHTYNIRINKPHINVTTSITNWDAVDAVNEIGTLQ